MPGSETLTYLSTHNLGFRFFPTYGEESPSSALKGFGWKTFRRLGFGIWDLRRMAVMALFAVPKEVPQTL